MDNGLRPKILLAAALVFAADRLTKYFAIKCMALGESVKVIPGIFHITLVFNDGAAFGLLRNCAAFFIAFSLIVIVLIVLVLYRSRRLEIAQAVSIALVFGGAAGNLVDRIKFGYVIDFLDFRVWPVFNIADSAITIGVSLMIINQFFKRAG